jgi:hypothetical protein
VSLQSRSEDQNRSRVQEEELLKILCSEGGREEHGRIHILTKKIVKDKGVGAS